MLADGSGTGRADPAFDAHVAPIGHWAMAIWETWAPRPLLQRLVVRAKLRISVAKSPWANVHGPAAAFVASALRLQWVIHDALRVTMDNGVNLHFAVDSPAFVKRAVCQSVRRWRWRAIGSRIDGADPDGCGDGSFMLPIFRLLDPRYQCTDTAWGSAQRAGLRSALADRQWTQDRLHAAHLAPSPECQLCWAAAQWDADHGSRTCRHPIARGTKIHRLWECPVTEPWRLQVAPPVLLRRRAAAKQAGLVNTAMWTRGMWPLRAQLVPKPPEEATFTWVKQPPDDCVDGTLYTDGSMIDGPPHYGGLCGRLGWSFVAISRQGRITASAHGSPPAWITTVYGAEVWALLMAATYALPGTAYRTDCQAALRVFLRGSAYATAGQSYYARVWAAVFAAFDDQGATTDILWLPAHTGPSHIGTAVLSDGSLMTRTDQSANDLADKLAKSAAQEFRVPELVRSRLAADQVLARQLAMWLGQATAMANACPSPDGKSVRDSRPAPRTTKIDVPNPPMVSRTRPAPLAPAARWAAKLRVGIIADDSASHATHRVRVTGDVTWCGRCGAYASMRGRGMAKPCRGVPSTVATRRWTVTRPSAVVTRTRTERTSRTRASKGGGCSSSARCKRAVRGAAMRLFALRSGIHPVTGLPLLAPLPVVTLPQAADGALAGVSPAAARLAALLARVRAREAGTSCPESASGGASPLRLPLASGSAQLLAHGPASGMERGTAASRRFAALRARVASREVHRSTARRRLDAIVTPDGFFHADFGGAGDCGYRAIAGALALGSGTPLVEVHAQVGGLAASLRAQITSATRSQRLGSDFFAIDPAWTEETEGGPVPTSFDEWVSATARPRRWIDGHGLATAAALLSRRILVWRWADEQWQRVAIFEPPEADPAAVASAMHMPVLPILVKDRHYTTLVPTPGTDWPSHWSAPVVRSWQPEFERGGSSRAAQLRHARRSACAKGRGVRQPSRLWAVAATYLSRAARPVLLAQCVRGTPPDGDSCGCETDADGQLRASDSLPSLDSVLLGSGDWGGSFGFLNSDSDFCRFLSDPYVLLCSCCCLDALFGIQWSHCCRYLGAELDLLPDAIGCCLRQTSRLWAAAASCLRKAA